jgi:hypothetical protein
MLTEIKRNFMETSNEQTCNEFFKTLKESYEKSGKRP